jgi:hypothetical protein
MRTRSTAVVLTLVLASPPWLRPSERATPPAPRPARVEGGRIVRPDGSELKIRGIGLGNWLLPEGYMWGIRKGPSSPRQLQELVSELLGPDEAARFWREFRESYVRREDIRLLGKIGLNVVRVPFDYRILSREDEPGTFREDGFAWLDRLMGWCRDEGLLVILDLHAAPGGQTGRNIDDSWGHPFLFESGESQDRTVELWKRIAERYVHEPALLGYDLLNEPLPPEPAYDGLKARLEPLYKRIVSAIREVDPEHVVILEGAAWDTDFSVFGPPFDKNLVYSFHKYWNDTTVESLRPFLDYRDRTRAPLFLGESGENTDAWVEACRILAEGQGIGWCFWPYKKLESPRGVASIPTPEGWSEVVAYAAARSADFEANARIRPSLAVAHDALFAFLRNARLENCRVNAGFVRALGLTPP